MASMSSPAERSKVETEAGAEPRTTEVQAFSPVARAEHDDPEGRQDGIPQTDANGLPVFAEDGTDLTVIRWMLAMNPDERLRWLQATMQAVAELTRGRINT